MLLRDELLPDLVELLNLFTRDRLAFCRALLDRLDNDASRIAVVAFDPLTPDTFVYSYDDTRLQIVLSKRRYFRGWRNGDRAEYLIVGLNDDRSVYAIYCEDRSCLDAYRRAYDVDLYQLDTTDQNGLVLPYGVDVRVQGDVVVRRIMSRGIAETVNTVYIYPDTSLKQVLDEVSRYAKLDRNMIRSIKIVVAHARRNRRTAYLDFPTYRLSDDLIAGKRGEVYDCISLGIRGGERHRICGGVEFLSREENYIIVRCLSEKLVFEHPTHRTVVLHVKPGDLLRISVIRPEIAIPHLSVPLDRVDLTTAVAAHIVARMGEINAVLHLMSGDLDRTVARWCRNRVHSFFLTPEVVRRVREIVEELRREAETLALIRWRRLVDTETVLRIARALDVRMIEQLRWVDIRVGDHAKAIAEDEGYAKALVEVENVEQYILDSRLASSYGAKGFARRAQRVARVLSEKYRCRSVAVVYTFRAWFICSENYELCVGI